MQPDITIPISALVMMASFLASMVVIITALFGIQRSAKKWFAGLIHQQTTELQEGQSKLEHRVGNLEDKMGRLELTVNNLQPDRP